MVCKSKVRLKYITLISLLFISQGLTGCRIIFNSSVDHDRTFYSIQKEKTSISTHSRYHRIRYFTFKKDFWHDLKKEFALVHYTNKQEVKEQIRLFLKRSHQLKNKLKHRAPYIHYVYQQVKNRQLPAELALLPFIESTYDPVAFHKTSNASGLWQLTPGTAQRFGVRQDAIFDGKYDLYTSTHAALDSLTYLNQLFCGNWLLTLAAYNAGEGNVRRAMDYNTKNGRSPSFWKLPLALETTHYVPKLLALSAIIKDPKKYGIELPPISKALYLESVDVSAGISIIHAAAFANISVKELKRFNPGFKQLALIPKHSYRILLPVACIPTFKKNMTAASLHGLDLKVSYYLVKPGDTLNNIAKQQRITKEQLCLWNGLKSNQILPTHKKLVIMKMSPPHNTR